MSFELLYDGGPGRPVAKNRVVASRSTSRTITFAVSDDIALAMHIKATDNVIVALGTGLDQGWLRIAAAHNRDYVTVPVCGTRGRQLRININKAFLGVKVPAKAVTLPHKLVTCRDGRAGQSLLIDLTQLKKSALPYQRSQLHERINGPAG